MDGPTLAFFGIGLAVIFLIMAVGDQLATLRPVLTDGCAVLFVVEDVRSFAHFGKCHRLPLSLPRMEPCRVSG